MQYSSIYLVVGVFFVMSSYYGCVNGAARNRGQNGEELILKKWEEGLSVQEIDALIEARKEELVNLGYNRLEVERRIHYVKRKAASRIKQQECRPMHAITQAKWEESDFILFHSRSTPVSKSGDYLRLDGKEERNDQGCSCVVL